MPSETSGGANNGDASTNTAEVEETTAVTEGTPAGGEQAEPDSE